MFLVFEIGFPPNFNTAMYIQQCNTRSIWPYHLKADSRQIQGIEFGCLYEVVVHAVILQTDIVYGNFAWIPALINFRFNMIPQIS